MKNIKNLQNLPKFLQFFLQEGIRQDLAIQKLSLATFLIIIFYFPVMESIGFLTVLPFLLYVFIWYMITYSIALYLQPEKDSYHRWLLFFANLTLFALPIILANRLASGMKNPMASKLAKFMTTIILWWALGFLFSMIVISVPGIFS